MTVALDQTASPEGWRRVTFGDVVKNCGETTTDPLADGLERVVGLDHLTPGSQIVERWDDFVDLLDGTSFSRIFRSGQTLFGKRRAYQRKVSVPDFDGICSGDILVFDSKSEDVMLPGFVSLVAMSDAFFRYALSTSAGSLSPRTSWKHLSAFSFDLPPLFEQRRIVDLIGQIDQDLVREQRVETELRRTLESFVSHSLSVDGSADRSRQMTTLAECSLLNPTQVPGEERTGELCYIDLKAVSLEGGIDPSAVVKMAWDDAPSRARRRLRNGDSLVSTVRPYLKGVARVGRAEDGFVASTGFCVVRAKAGETIPGFVWAVVRSPQFFRHLTRYQTGSNYPAVSPADVGSFRLPLLSLAEQDRISAVVGDIDAAIVAKRDDVEKLRDLRLALLAKLLSGEHRIPESYDDSMTRSE